MLRRCAGWHEPIEQILRDTRPEDVTGYPAYDRAPLQAIRQDILCSNEASADGSTGGRSSSSSALSSTSVSAANMLQQDLHLSGRRLADTATRVTLLGDAAHPMSPFKGQGANQALLDAVALARALRAHERLGEHKLSLPAALQRFEQEMLTRSRAKVMASSEAVELLHSAAATAKSNSTRARSARDNERGTARSSGVEPSTDLTSRGA